jgi:transposase
MSLLNHLTSIVQCSVPGAVTAYLKSEAVTSVPLPAMSPDFNPIEHLWNMLGRRIHAREPPVQNIQWVVIEMGDNNWLQDVSDVLITS